MRTKLLAVQLLIMSVAVSAAAGGVGSTTPCTFVNDVLMSAPLQVYLPDGFTEQTVGEASIVSRKSICNTGEFEVIDINFKLADEIQPYGIKIKDSINVFETYVSLDFRLKELVNSTESFRASIYSTTKINHFDSLGVLEIKMEKPEIFFWMNTQSTIKDIINAQSNGHSVDNRPLRCSLQKAFVRITKKASGTEVLEKDLNLTAVFQGPLQFCPTD